MSSSWSPGLEVEGQQVALGQAQGQPWRFTESYATEVEDQSSEDALQF